MGGAPGNDTDLVDVGQAAGGPPHSRSQPRARRTVRHAACSATSGADVIKLQTTERATLVNDPANPYYYVWNRSKRAVSLNMKHPGALDVARRLIEHSDVVVENFSAGVLDRWGLSYEDVRAWNSSIVYVTMSGCGHVGPWSNLVTYAPTIHALAGITYLSNPAGRGDVGPGLLTQRPRIRAVGGGGHPRRPGRPPAVPGMGQHVDISQLEVGAYLIGPALLDVSDQRSRSPVPVGNADPLGPACPTAATAPPTAPGWR